MTFDLFKHNAHHQIKRKIVIKEKNNHLYIDITVSLIFSLQCLVDISDAQKI
jgi:hypothetical protein